MPLYVYSACSGRTTSHGTDIRHTAGAIVAANEDEAFGAAARLARQRWPLEDGWRTPSVEVGPVSIEAIREAHAALT